MTHTDVQCHQYPHRSRCNSGGGRGWTSLETCECAPPLTMRGRMHEGGQSEIQQRNQLLWVFFNTRYTSTTNCILLLIKQLQTFEGGPVVRRLVRNETLPEVQRQWRPGKSCKLASYSLIWGCDCVSYPQYFHGISSNFSMGMQETHFTVNQQRGPLMFLQVRRKDGGGRTTAIHLLITYSLCVSCSKKKSWTVYNYHLNTTFMLAQQYWRL